MLLQVLVLFYNTDELHLCVVRQVDSLQRTSWQFERPLVSVYIASALSPPSNQFLCHSLVNTLCSGLESSAGRVHRTQYFGYTSDTGSAPSGLGFPNCQDVLLHTRYKTPTQYCCYCTIILVLITRTLHLPCTRVHRVCMYLHLYGVYATTCTYSTTVLEYLE
jgi:hypothetical protein